MDRFKSIGAKIRKFFSCIVGEVWIHIATLLIVFIIGGLMIMMFSNPEFATPVFGLVLVCAIIVFCLYLAYHLYMMIFDFICEVIDRWDRS